MKELEFSKKFKVSIFLMRLLRMNKMKHLLFYFRCFIVRKHLSKKWKQNQNNGKFLLLILFIMGLNWLEFL